MYNERKCNAAELETLIAATPDGGVCALEKKEYYLTRRVDIRGRRGLTVNGGEARIVTRFVNSAPAEESAEAFLIEGCQDLTLCDMVIDTDLPTNISATVESVDREGSSIVIAVDSRFKIHGDEALMAFDSVDADGSFDWKLHHYSLHPDPNIVTLIHGEILLANTYSGAPCDYLGDNRFRVYFPPHEDKLRDAAVGMRLCIRHTLKGLGAIVLRDSDRTALRDITIRSAPCMAVIVLPRCHDLTIEGLRVRTEEGGPYMACNTDGVHIAGLGGRLIMRDCIFDGMGDDSLNVHSTLGTVTRVKDSLTFVCNYCKKSPDGALPPAWCREGDTVRVYDPVSMKRTATLTVRSFEGGVLRASAVDGRVSSGDVIQNLAMSPSAEISGCRVKNSVARGFIIQTDNVTLEDCELYGIASSAVKVAPDLDYWYEAGPTEHFCMRGNRMEKCSFARGSSVIEVQTNHMERSLAVTGLHRDIRIEGNTFVNTPAVCVDVRSTDGVRVVGNSFHGCAARELVNTEYCENVTVENNR